MMLWTLAATVTIIYCIARGIVDLRQRRYLWGALGLLSALMLALAPVKTHAVKLILPAPATR